MLGGLDPVIIFQFSSLAPSLGETLSRVPVISNFPSLIAQPPIPVYLSERLFNISIVSAGKSVDIETSTDTLSDGTEADINQKGIQSGIEVTLEGKADSIALTLLSSLIDSVFEKVTSKEYAISFLYGATTVFRGVLQNYSAETVEGTDKLQIKFRISKGAKNPVKPPAVGAVTGTVGVLPGG